MNIISKKWGSHIKHKLNFTSNQKKTHYAIYLNIEEIVEFIKRKMKLKKEGKEEKDHKSY